MLLLEPAIFRGASRAFPAGQEPGWGCPAGEAVEGRGAAASSPRPPQEASFFPLRDYSQACRCMCSLRNRGFSGPGAAPVTEEAKLAGWEATRPWFLSSAIGPPWLTAATLRKCLDGGVSPSVSPIPGPLTPASKGQLSNTVACIQVLTSGKAVGETQIKPTSPCDSV